MTLDINGARLYTPEAAAELINGTRDANGSRRIVAPATLKEWARKRQIPHTIFGRKICFTLDQIKAAVAAHEVPIVKPEDVETPDLSGISSLTKGSKRHLQRKAMAR